MRPTDSALAEPLGTFGLIALACAVAWLRLRVLERRERRAAERRTALLAATRPRTVLTGWCAFPGCDDPACPARLTRGGAA